MRESTFCNRYCSIRSLKILDKCKAEPALADAESLDRFQFERMGYFCADPYSGKEKLIFNRTVGLKDTWAKIQQKDQK